MHKADIFKGVNSCFPKWITGDQFPVSGIYMYTYLYLYFMYLLCIEGPGRASMEHGEHSLPIRVSTMCQMRGGRCQVITHLRTCISQQISVALLKWVFIHVV